MKPRAHLAVLLAGTILSAGPVLANEEIGPLSLGASYALDVLSNVSGGQERGTGALGRAHANAELDGGKLGLGGVTAYFDLVFTHGPDFSGRFVGDGQGVSGNQGDRHDHVKPLEAWLVLPLGLDGLSAKAGLIDLNTEFDVQEVGKFFLHGSHGMGPDFSQSGLNGPSVYPNTAVGAVARLDGGVWQARLSAFDALAGSEDEPDLPVFRIPGEHGTLLAAEAGLRLDETAWLKLGAWHYTSRFDALLPTNSAPERRRSYGGYGTLEGTLAGSKDSATLDAWLRIGAAAPAVNPIGTYVGGGITYGTDESRAGIAVAHARLGNPQHRAALLSGIDARRAETAIEASYARTVLNRIVLQPDLQYIVDPGWDGARENALVIGLRVQLKLL